MFLKTTTCLLAAAALTLGAVSLAPTTPAQACPSKAAAKKTQGERLAWRTDLDAALADARKEARPAMVFFSTDACGSCDKMVDKTLTDPEVEAALDGFIKVHVDMTDGQDEAIKALADKYGVASLPSVLFFDEKGELVQSIKLEKFVPANDFLPVVKKVASRS